ncbi:MAG: hypothetical protein KGI97_01450 [Alphaproteobacteria bacterium]|nr:hypothetical protein [Alphaproteobacteria bacterium]
MRLSLLTLAIGLTIGAATAAAAEAKPAPASPQQPPRQIEVTADQSLEWYQDKNLYVARGNAKAVRGDTTITADLLTAHQRETPKGEKPVKTANGQKSDAGNIDLMTADGHVLITRPNGTHIIGDHAEDDTDQHVIVVTGHDLSYTSGQLRVTARDSLEYWDLKKLAIARGNAVAVKGDRHVEGDVLTAEFRAQPNGQDQLYKMTAQGHVTVITKNDVTRGDRAVYDAARDIAIVSGHVRITRANGMQLTGDVAESDFKTNQSRLMNDGSGRVRALLPAHMGPSKSAPQSKKTEGAP